MDRSRSPLPSHLSSFPQPPQLRTRTSSSSLNASAKAAASVEAVPAGRSSFESRGSTTQVVAPRPHHPTLRGRSSSFSGRPTTPLVATFFPDSPARQPLLGHTPSASVSSSATHPSGLSSRSPSPTREGGRPSRISFLAYSDGPGPASPLLPSFTPTSSAARWSDSSGRKKSGRSPLYRPRNIVAFFTLLTLCTSMYFHTFHPETTEAFANAVLSKTSAAVDGATEKVKGLGFGGGLVGMNEWGQLNSGREGAEGHLPLSPWNRFKETWSKEKEDSVLDKHYATGLGDGRLLIKAGEPHPIPILMQRAQKRWESLKRKQSTTFAEAVLEYQRRHGRRPPRGFDRWYAFARAHQVQLIDEFDIIEHSLRPFRAFSPASLRARAIAASNFDYTWGIRVVDGRIYREGELAHHDRAKGVESMCAKFKHELPDMYMSYNAHDGARINLGWEERMRLEDLVESGQWEEWNEKEDPEMKPVMPSPPPGWGIPQTCETTSAMRTEDFEYGWANKSRTGLELAEVPSGSIGTLIGGFEQYADVCNSPQYRHFHSSTSWSFQTWPTSVLPLFTPGVHARFGDPYAIITEQFADTFEESVPWEERSHAKAVWVGQASGALYDALTPWQSTQRPRLHLLANKDNSGQRNIVIADEQGLAKTVEVDKAQLNAEYFDAGIVGPAEQCVQEDGTCDKIPTVLEPYHNYMSFDEQNQYKYLLDIDGNSWSGRFRRLMLSKGAVLKATIFPEYWTDWAVPWLHFIPLQVDYADIWDVLAFFRGSPKDGAYGHDDLAKEIGRQGREFARTHMRYADIEAFTFRQMLEYGRLYNADREDMDFVLEVEDFEPLWYSH